MTDQPWYPPEWLDADGKPLPDVHEVTPGEWPPCRPGDFVQVCLRLDREFQELSVLPAVAGLLNWCELGVSTIVAIRIIRRAGA